MRVFSFPFPPPCLRGGGPGGWSFSGDAGGTHMLREMRPVLSHGREKGGHPEGLQRVSPLLPPLLAHSHGQQTGEPSGDSGSAGGL